MMKKTAHVIERIICASGNIVVASIGATCVAMLIYNVVNLIYQLIQ